MYYYQFHIGDYRAATAHLSNDEDLAYRRLLDMYYDSEKPIPVDTEWVSRRLRLGSDVVLSVLQDFFILQDDGWFHPKCDEIIDHYHSTAEKNRNNGRLGGRPKKTQWDTNGNPTETQSEPTGKATSNHKPITINQELLLKDRKQTASRLPTDWMPNDEQIEYCKTKRPDLQWQQVAENFRDYWVSAPGVKGRKADWSATWRTWVRNEKSKFKPYESAKDKSRREFNEQIWGAVNNDQSIIDIN
jgi:uncharacterized protein YdaU (DUF1376 family)